MTVIEGMAPNLSANRAGAEVSPYFLRRDVPITAFPDERAEAVSKFFPLIMGSWELCRCVIETNLENINLLVRRGFVDIVDALLGRNSWQDGLTLERLGLADMSPEQIPTYVETGR